jgi:hypothetical protein
MSLRKRCVALAIWNEVKSSNRQGCDCFPSLAMTVNIFVQLLTFLYTVWFYCVHLLILSITYCPYPLSAARTLIYFHDSNIALLATNAKTL